MPMKKQIILPLLLLVAPFLGWRAYQHYVPIDVSNVTITAKDINGWQTYHNKLFNFEVKYPKNYFLCYQTITSRIQVISSNRFPLRQNTTSDEECATAGKEITIYVYPLSQISSFGLNGETIKLTKEVTVDDIARQYLEQETNRPGVPHSCYPQDINGIKSITCTKRAPGESRGISGGIFKVSVLGIHELADGERILVVVSNSGGGIPYTGDHALHRETIRVFHTIEFMDQ